jgi:hypothetical protein
VNLEGVEHVGPLLFHYVNVFFPHGPLVWLLASFLITFFISRYITFRIRSGRGRLSDLALGAIHIHHMVWGVGLVLVSGTAAFAFGPGPFAVAPAIAFGAGAALMLDEFALILYLRDVYWAQEGRLSLVAVLVVAIAIGMFALPFGQLPEYGLPILTAFVLLYVLFTAITLAKGKVFTSIGGLFVPLLVLYGGLRLARPDSPWARFWYTRNPEKLHRARARYERVGAVGRRRQQLLEIMSVTEPPDADVHGPGVKERELWLGLAEGAH